jgi:hypothetical protein
MPAMTPQPTEQAMNSQNEDRDENAEVVDELDQHGLALHELIQEYLDEHDLSDQMGCVILLGMCIRMRMIGYALETGQPSASGLKMDLDRFRHDIDDAMRAAKKGAEEFIEEALVLREAAEDEIEDELDEIEDEQKDKKGKKDVPS